MAIELVTGKTGTLHVSSEDDRLLHARTIGEGSYVLHGCECEMASANILHIGEGELMAQGGFVRITGGGEDVTIANGSQGEKRNTLVCFDWSKDGQGIETPSFVAIDGAPTTGAPADPAYADGDMNGGDSHVQVPFCRLTLDGLAVGEPVVLFDDFQPLAEFRDSASQHLAELDEDADRLDIVTLWEGDVWLDATTKLKLSRPLTGAQMLYFVWSYCNTSDETENTGWQTVPVSMKLYPWNSGHDMLLQHGSDYVGMKYVYIDRQEVSGHSRNVTSGVSGSGIRWDNTAFSLRGIYGQW